MEDYAKGAYAVTLRCGFDLDANTFWKSLGYNCVNILEGGVRRMRKINVWRKVLSAELFKEDFLIPAEGKTNSSLWRRNRVKGINTGFSRGKKLHDYRKFLVQRDSEEK